MSVILSAIVAVSDSNAIGKDNNLLWHISEDFKYFKRVTMGKPMVMGRKTFESLPGMLKGRPHVVVSRTPGGQEPEKPDLHYYSSLEAGIEKAYGLAEKMGVDEIFVIGGAEIYRQVLGRLDRLYLTRVHRRYDDADTFFPDIDINAWRVVSEEYHEGDPAFTFFVLEPKR